MACSLPDSVGKWGCVCSETPSGIGRGGLDEVANQLGESALYGPPNHQAKHTSMILFQDSYL